MLEKLPSSPTRSPTPPTRTSSSQPRAQPRAPAVHDAGVHPDNDGHTLVLGGFPRDSEREIINQYLEQNVLNGNFDDLLDAEAKYPRGSVALLRFRSTSGLWTFIRNRHKFTYQTNVLWYTIPRTPKERERSQVITSMRKALAELLPQETITVNWDTSQICINKIPVARLSPVDDLKMEISPSQLKTAIGDRITKDDVYAKFLSFNPPATESHADDWA